MKRTILFTTAIAICLACSSIAASAAKPVTTKVTLEYAPPAPGDPYGRSEFDGTVSAKKGCAAKRKISVSGAGKTKSAKSGDYSITLNSTPEGKFTAIVKKQTIKKGNKKIVCAAAKSKPVTVP